MFIHYVPGGVAAEEDEDDAEQDDAQVDLLALDSGRAEPLWKEGPMLRSLFWGDFHQFSAEKLAFFLKTNAVIRLFLPNFSATIFKII
jgi:hypothetical protein